MKHMAIADNHFCDGAAPPLVSNRGEFTAVPRFHDLAGSAYPCVASATINSKERSTSIVVRCARLICALIWVAGVARPAFAEIRLTVANKELIYDQPSRAAAGGFWWPDGNMGVVKLSGNQYSFNAANSIQEITTTGTLTSPAQSRAAVAYSNLKGAYNYMAGGELYRDAASGRYVHFYHSEIYIGGDPTNFRSALGMAVSRDSTLGSFDDLGVILTAPGTGHVEMCGAPYVVSRDGYFHVYFNANGLAVARAKVTDVVSNALVGVSSSFLKYYNGSFSEPGIEGRATAIQSGACQWMDVVYDRYLDKFVLVVVENNDLWLSWSDDGVTNWSPRQRLEAEAGESFYPTIVSADSDPKIVSRGQFYVYYTYSIQGAFNRWNDATLVRRAITLNDPAPKLATIVAAQLSVALGQTSTFQISVPTSLGQTYLLDYTDSLSPIEWKWLATVTGDATVQRLVDPSPPPDQRFYRVRVQ
jgi:hypothetical protein